MCEGGGGGGWGGGDSYGSDVCIYLMDDAFPTAKTRTSGK